MTKTLQELSDRQEIQDVMVAYAYAIDRKNFDELDEVFTPDAVIDYSEMVGFRGNLQETKKFLVAGLSQLKAYQHSISTSQIRIEGDTAHGRTLCFNPMTVPLGEGKEQTMFVGLWYRDVFVRTPKGWRIKERYEEKCFMHNVPPGVFPE
jgi:3-phenylpropionate/cinnamic acid dioxygenase small subunit